jgi:riboflavin kinase/FMN adenylyltransferase
MAELVQLKNVQRDDNSVVTVGTFDGVHAGHHVLINKVVEKAKAVKGRSVIVTFDPHPREIINPGKAGIRLLTSLNERCELLAALGVDLMVVIPFDRDFSLLTSEEFIRDVIWKKIGVKEFIIGYDHQFGRNREGTIDTVKEVGKELGFGAHVVSKQEVEDRTVSSTVIRRALQESGDVKLAANLLERPYMIHGTVIHGDKRGKSIGFPTANIRVDDHRKIIPEIGVYAVKVRVEGKMYGGMMNIGVRPTFEGDDLPTIEVHIFDFDRDIYGYQIQIRFIDRLRNEKKFSGIDELTDQLAKDMDAAKKLLSE